MHQKLPVIVLTVLAILIVAEAIWHTTVQHSTTLPPDQAIARLTTLDAIHPFSQEAAEKLAELQWNLVVETGNYAHAELAYDLARERMSHSADPRWLARTAWLAVVLYQDLHRDSAGTE